jgi:hypothetical protein
MLDIYGDLELFAIYTNIPTIFEIYAGKPQES